jgi:hypothetical protein
MTTFILGAIVGLCAWLLFFAVRWLQPRFWPPARRQERYRIRLRKTREELRQARKAEEASLASRLSVKERRALHSLGPSPAGSPTMESPIRVKVSGAGLVSTEATIPPS